MSSSNSRLQDWEKDFTHRVIGAEEWESQRGNFTKLYSTYKLNKTRKIMAIKYKFYARPKQCKTAIAKWGLGKNLKQKKMLKMLWIQDDRRLQGKLTTFRFKGKRVKKETLERCRKRYKGTGDVPEWQKLNPPVSPPSDVDCLTPTSSNGLDDSSPRSEGGVLSPMICSKPSSPRENTVNGASLDQSDDIEDFFDLDSFAGELSSTSFPSLEEEEEEEEEEGEEEEEEEEQETVKRSSEPGSSSSGQKPEPLIRPLNTSAPPTTCDVTTHEQKFPARAGWLESPQLRPEGARALCLDCLMGGFTSHGALSAESILFEAFGGRSPNHNSDYQISSNCTSGFCPAQFKINHPETHYFSTSLFVEQIRPVHV